MCQDIRHSQVRNAIVTVRSPPASTRLLRPRSPPKALCRYSHASACLFARRSLTCLTNCVRLSLVMAGRLSTNGRAVTSCWTYTAYASMTTRLHSARANHCESYPPTHWKGHSRDWSRVLRMGCIRPPDSHSRHDGRRSRRQLRRRSRQLCAAAPLVGARRGDCRQGQSRRCPALPRTASSRCCCCHHRQQESCRRRCHQQQRRRERNGTRERARGV